MRRITPKDFYLDLPYSYVDIECAKGGLQDVKVSVKADGYATLRDTNKAIRDSGLWEDYASIFSGKHNK
ncbi:MAG: hypothetical protein IKP60_07040 [Treponema sp.]|nr:hypothetical protein [Treponema sp.]